MSGAGILLMRRAKPDVAVDNNKRWRIVATLECLQRLCQLLCVVGIVDPVHDPVIPAKPRRHIFTESEVCLSLNRDPVAVVDPAQIPELKMAGDRCGFARDALHHVAVATQRINLETKRRGVRPVEVPPEPATRDGHADAVPASLS